MQRLTAALSDRYTIERELGAGGMATVYLAEDLKHKRKVAIKVLKPELAAVLGADRFVKEIEVTANLQHPNLLPLFDSGVAVGLIYYVMPYVEGETLRARLDRETQLPVSETLRLVTLLAGALDYAHARGVVHRDLKPENILLQAGQPVVADFGIALAVAQAGGTRITQTGLSLGTPHYMSPEQAMADRVIDARSDQYSLGALTYEMLTGEPPHTGATSQAIIARLLTETPRSTRATRPTISPLLDYAVLRALAKTPADRFDSCGEFARVAGDTSDVVGVSAPGSMLRRRRLQLAGVAVFCLVAFLAVRLGHWGKGDRDGTPRVVADTAAQRLVALADNDFSRRDSVGCDRAIARYSEAIDKDSTSAAAYAGMAQARAVCAAFGYGRPLVEMAAAKSAIETALRLDGSVANTYTTRGFVHVAFDHDYAAGERDFRKAIAIDSMQFTAWLYRAWYYVAIGKLDSAVTSLRRAKALAPASNIVGTRLAMVLRLAGDNAGAERELAEVLSRDSTDINAHTVMLQVEMETGRCAETLREQRFLVRSRSYIAGVAAAAQARCHDAASAHAFVATQHARAAAGEYIDNFALAMVHAALGDTTAMFIALGQANDDRHPLMFLLGAEQLFRPYHNDPRYRQLMQRARLP